MKLNFDRGVENMGYNQVIPLVGALLELGFKIADMIEQAVEIDPADKEALKQRIKAAQAGVKYWQDGTFGDSK